MRRRQFMAGAALAGAAAAGSGLAQPALSQPALAQSAASTLRFVPQADLANPDPIWTSATVAYNHGNMVWDVLYALDASYVAQPQMASGHTLSDDRLTWRITLRDGLLFHDGTPVRAADCIPSIDRYAHRKPLGQVLLSRLDAMRAVDDRTLEIRLKRPYGLLPDTLADGCFIMPERIARTDPFTQIKEFVGSGPFRFLAAEWQPGSRAAYARNDKYVPRAEPPSYLAGGKVVHVDRVEWVTIPDPATAASALQSGEVDFVEYPLIDLLPVLRAASGVRVVLNDPVGNLAMLAFNHTQPPFDNRKLLQALLPAIDQKSFMEAAFGADPTLYRTGVGVFTAGQPMASTAGLEALTGPRDMGLARRLVAESGYKGEPVVLMSPSDQASLQAFVQVASALYKQLGLNVQYVSTDWGTLVSRRTSHEPVSKGGWSGYSTTWTGLSVANPAVNLPLRGNGDAGWFGWPTDPAMEALRDQWLDAGPLPAQQAIAAQMQRLAFTDVPFIPIGQVFQPIALRSTVTDVIRSPTPLFWGLRKA